MLKKILLFMLVCCIMTTAVSPAVVLAKEEGSYGENLLAVSDFETPVTEGGSTIQSTGGSVTEEFKHGGNASYKVNVPPNQNFNGIYHLPYAPAEPNYKTYYYSAWVRVDPQTAGTHDIFAVSRVVHKNSAGAVVSDKDYTLEHVTVDAASDFVHLEGYYTLEENVPENGSLLLRFKIVLRGSGDETVTFYVDDLYLGEYQQPVGEIHVEEVSPADGETLVDTDAVINLAFDAPLERSTLTEDAVKINGSPALVDRVRTGVSDASIYLKGLAPMTDYTLELDGVKSGTGALLEFTPITFRTGYGEKNLFANGRFEDPSAVLPPGAEAYQTEHKSGGRYGVRAVSTWRFGGLYELKMPELIPGKRYAYSMQAKLDSTVTAATDVCVFYNFKFSDNGVKQKEIDRKKITANMGFVEFSGTFTAPEGTLETGSVPQMMLVVDSGSAVTFYADDIVVRALPEGEELEATQLGDVYPGSKTEVKGNAFSVCFDWELEDDEILPEQVLIDGSSQNISSVERIGPRELLVRLSQPLAYANTYQLSFQGVADTLGRPAGKIDFETTAMCTVKDGGFYLNYGMDGQQNADVLVPGAVTYACRAENHAEAPCGAALVLLLMRDGYVEDIAYGQKILAGEEAEGTLMATLQVPDLSGGVYQLRALALDGLDTLQPLMDSMVQLEETGTEILGLQTEKSASGEIKELLAKGEADGRKLQIRCHTVGTQPAEKPAVLLLTRPGRNIREVIQGDAEIREVVAYLDMQNPIDGRYRFAYTLPENAEYGEYTATAALQGQKSLAGAKLYYASEDAVAQALQAVAEAKQTGASAQLLAGQDALGIRDVLKVLNTYTGGISLAEKFVKNYVFDGKTAAQFRSDLENSVLPSMMAYTTQENLAEIFSDYNRFMDTGFDTGKMTKEEKQVFARIIVSEQKNSPREFAEFYHMAELLTALNLMPWNDMEAFFEENHEVLGVNLDGTFGELQSPEMVYKSLSKQELYSKKALAEAFSKAVDEQYRAENSGQENRPGGGGSGSGGGGSRPGGGGSGNGVTQGYLPNELQNQPTAPPEEKFSFEDLSEASWAKIYIEELVKAQVISKAPDRRFRPNDAVTREEFVKLLVLAVGESPVQGASSFDDVQEEMWYTPYINAAQQRGFVQGKGQSFGVGEQISRQDMAVMIFRAMENLPESGEQEPVFRDQTQISPYAVDAVLQLSKAQWIHGYEDGNFVPFGTATRAESAKLIFMLYQAKKEA